jgi:hypothetical protein
MESMDGKTSLHGSNLLAVTVYSNLLARHGASINIHSKGAMTPLTRWLRKVVNILKSAFGHDDVNRCAQKVIL